MKKDNVVEVKGESLVELMAEHHVRADAVMEEAGVANMRELYSSPGLVQKYKDELAVLDQLGERFDSAVKKLSAARRKENPGRLFLPEENFRPKSL
jgi:hypothetical protein